MNLLPIDSLKSDFLAAFQHSHIVVEAPTGSGKSTRLPLWCGEQGRTLVIEPRRIACRSLALHVAELAESEVGSKVGYGIRFDSCFSKLSQIIFVTPGIALSWLAQDQLEGFDTIIIDEFHERRWDTDLLLALLKKRDSHRLVVTSATMEGERLAAYLAAEKLRAEGRIYPVEISYSSVDQLPSLKDLEQRIAHQARRVLLEYGEGDVLVFLPGKGEIEAALAALKGKVDALLIPLHASVDRQQQDLALRPTSQRRVILATNVAETSLTIPGVRIVIDSGLERRTHHRGGRTVLGLHPIAQASADQRAGRAGRLGAGYAIRLWGRGVPLEPFTPPEVLREELTELLLASASSGIPVGELDFPDKLPEHAVKRATSRLMAMAAIDDQGQLTEHGQRLAPLPLDALFAHLISAMPDEACCAAMIDLSSALSAGRRLWRASHRESEIKALSEWQPIPCDATTLIKLLREGAPEEVNIDNQTLKEARRTANDVRHTLGLHTIKKGESIPRESLLQHAITALPELAFVRRKKRQHALGNGYSEVEISRDSRFDEESEAAVVFDQHSVSGRGTRDTRNFATCMAPISFKQLVDAGIGESVYAEPFMQEGELLVERRIEYAGRTLTSSATAPTGEPLRKALVQLIWQNRLMKGQGEMLREAIEDWNLYLHLGIGEGESIAVDTWLEQRLSELGVEQFDDMELIEEADLHFDGIPQWELEDFQRSYPRQLKLQNMQVRVEYKPKAKRIILHRIGGHRKTAPQRKELPCWSGWRLRFKDASREMEIH